MRILDGKNRLNTFLTLHPDAFKPKTTNGDAGEESRQSNNNVLGSVKKKIKSSLVGITAFGELHYLSMLVIFINVVLPSFLLFP